jgi:group I intron endonuclease
VLLKLFIKPIIKMKLITGTEVKTKVGGGIYYVQCLKNKKRYVGSSVDIYYRWRQYVRGDVSNKSLLKDMITYGIDNFEMGVLETIEMGTLSREDYSTILFEREAFFIKLLNVCDSEIGYNKTDDTVNSNRNTAPKFVFSKNLKTKEVLSFDTIAQCGKYLFEYAEKTNQPTSLKICRDRISEIAGQTRKGKNIYSFKDHTFALTHQGLYVLEDYYNNSQTPKSIRIVELDIVFPSVNAAAEHIETILNKKVWASTIRGCMKTSKRTMGYTFEWFE